jgi:hypothetical protein
VLVSLSNPPVSDGIQLISFSSDLPENLGFKKKNYIYDRCQKTPNMAAFQGGVG